MALLILALLQRIFLMSSLMLFFYSSIRRHTISLCDWSSDVCSSDLTRDALRPGKPKSRFFNRVHPRELSPVGSRRNPVAQSGPHRSTHRHGGKDHRTFLRGVAP